ncbi:hypothetical protein [Rhizobium sp.]|uniref:hypothetical protein n=1 Tax=Rhizobium sp. TaxID=391 RepID=UPI0028AAF169
MQVRTSDHSEDVKRAATWLADRRQFSIAGGLVLTPDGLAPVIPTLKARFDLTDGDAAEAILLAGNYSICRRAFG